MFPKFIKSMLPLPSFFTISMPTDEEPTVFPIQPPPQCILCPLCQGKTSRHDKRRRRFRHGYAWHIGTLWIELEVPRQRCTSCDYTFTFDYGLGIIRSSTASFRREIVQRCHGRVLTDVARGYHLPYTTVERWFYRYVPEQLPDQTATRVCVDEFALRKGHHYATSVLNTDTGHVLAVVPHRDRDQDAMETALSLANGNVKAVVSDLAPAIAKAVGAVFPDAIHVLDRFHIIQFFTDALKIRRRYLGEEKKHHPFRLIDRCLSSKPTRLTEEERQFVAQWLTEDEHTRHLYQALQHIRYVFQSTTVKQVKRRFSDWIKRYQSHVFGAVSKIAKRFVLREKAMIDTILSPLSNGLMEGVNNKIKLIKRRGPFLSVHSIRNRALIWSSLTFGDEQINLHKSKISLYILQSLFYIINTDIW